MPNHVTNRLTASPGIIDSVINKDGEVDFELILPTPAEIKAVGPSVNMDIPEWAEFATGHKLVSSLAPTLSRSPLDLFREGDYGALTDILGKGNAIRMLNEGPFPKDYSDQDFEQLLACMRALRATGYAYWYEWNTANWGTKWNAYETKRTAANIVTFKTAWSPPLKVILALSDRYPIEDPLLEWADEDFGCNVGSVVFRGGDVSNGKRIENQSPRAYELALDILYDGVLQPNMRWTELRTIEFKDEEESHA